MKTSSRQQFMTVFPSALGWMAGAWRGSQLLGLTFNHADPQAATNALLATRGIGCDGQATPSEMASTSQQSRLIARLQAFADGGDDDFADVVLELSGLTDFQCRVIHYCRRIPAGKAVTYGQLAAQVGSPGAARAVGQVMATNRWPLIVPCHRVIGSQGGLGGYSAPEGLAVKRRLLEREGVLLKSAPRLPAMQG